MEDKKDGGYALVMDESIRYAAAACQVDRPNPTRRAEIEPNVERMLEMVDMAVTGYEPMMDVRLGCISRICSCRADLPNGQGPM